MLVCCMHACAQVAAACMSRLAKMAARHMGNHGFSIGIDDVTPRPRLASAKAREEWGAGRAGGMRGPFLGGWPGEGLVWSYWS